MWLVGPAGNCFPHELTYMQFMGAGATYIVGSRGGASDGGTKKHMLFKTDGT